MKSKVDIIDFLVSKLKEILPNDDIELFYQTPFQLLVAVMLSAQATDRQVNKVTEKLFLYIKKPQDVVKKGQEWLERHISSLNYFRTKAKHIYQTAKVLSASTKSKKEKGSDNKKTIEELLKEIFRSTKNVSFPPNSFTLQQKEEILKFLTSLPGVGIKTAKVVGSVLFGLDVIGVDTHIHRVANRIGLCQTKTPVQTSSVLEEKLSSENLRSLHHRLVLFGRYYCKAKNPVCPTCVFQSICLYYKSTLQVKKRK